MTEDHACRCMAKRKGDFSACARRYFSYAIPHMCCHVALSCTILKISMQLVCSRTKCTNNEIFCTDTLVFRKKLVMTRLSMRFTFDWEGRTYLLPFVMCPSDEGRKETMRTEKGGEVGTSSLCFRVFLCPVFNKKTKLEERRERKKFDLPFP